MSGGHWHAQRYSVQSLQSTVGPLRRGYLHPDQMFPLRNRESRESHELRCTVFERSRRLQSPVLNHWKERNHGSYCSATTELQTTGSLNLGASVANNLADYNEDVEAVLVKVVRQIGTCSNNIQTLFASLVLSAGAGSTLVTGCAIWCSMWPRRSWATRAWLPWRPASTAQRLPTVRGWIWPRWACKT